MSYIGLFSYYNFDNWAYQPSYVSSNTPWFFEGLRVQIFPTPHLKIEPWLINGWQSYGSANSRKGVGGQIKWTAEALGEHLFPITMVWATTTCIYRIGAESTPTTASRSSITTNRDSFSTRWHSPSPATWVRIGPSTATLAGVSCHGDKKDALAQRASIFRGGESILNRALSLYAVRPHVVQEGSVRTHGRRRPD